MRRGGIELTINQQARLNSIEKRQPIVFRQNNFNCAEPVQHLSSPRKHGDRVVFKSPFPKSVFEANQILMRESENIENTTHSRIQNKSTDIKCINTCKLLSCLMNKGQNQYVVNSNRAKKEKRVRFDIRQNNHLASKENQPSSKLRFKTPIRKKIFSPNVVMLTPTQSQITQNINCSKHQQKSVQRSPNHQVKVQQSIVYHEILIRPSLSTNKT